MSTHRAYYVVFYMSEALSHYLTLQSRQLNDVHQSLRFSISFIFTVSDTFVHCHLCICFRTSVMCVLLFGFIHCLIPSQLSMNSLPMLSITNRLSSYIHQSLISRFIDFLASCFYSYCFRYLSFLLSTAAILVFPMIHSSC
jgi:hypothetical protein